MLGLGGSRGRSPIRSLDGRSRVGGRVVALRLQRLDAHVALGDRPLVGVVGQEGADEADDEGVDFARLPGTLGAASPGAYADVGDDADDDEAPLAGEVSYAGARPSAQAVTGIDAVSEMVAVLGAQRSFEADASVFDAGKQLVAHTLEVENAS